MTTPVPPDGSVPPDYPPPPPTPTTEAQPAVPSVPAPPAPVTQPVAPASGPTPTTGAQPVAPTPADYAATSASRAVRDGMAFNVPVRPKVEPFLSTGPAQKPLLVERTWEGMQLKPEQRKLSRQRKIAEGLPEWSPKPPGEISVVRPARERGTK